MDLKPLMMTFFNVCNLKNIVMWYRINISMMIDKGMGQYILLRTRNTKLENTSPYSSTFSL